MTPHINQIRTLLGEIDEVLGKTNPRLPWWPGASELTQHRQTLDHLRHYLATLLEEMDAKGTFALPNAPLPLKSLEISPQDLEQATTPQAALSITQQAMQRFAQDLTQLQGSLLQPLQSEVRQLHQQRDSLLQEIRQLERQRQQYGLLPQPSVRGASPEEKRTPGSGVGLSQEQLIHDFLQGLMERLQERLSQQVSQTIASQTLMLENQDLSISPQIPNSTLAAEANLPPLHPAQRFEQLRMLQMRSDQMMVNLDTTLRVFAEALQQNIQGYQTSLSESLEKMHSLGQQGEALFGALINRLTEQMGEETIALIFNGSLEGRGPGALPAATTRFSSGETLPTTNTQLNAAASPGLAAPKIFNLPYAGSGVEESRGTRAEESAALDMTDLDFDELMEIGGDEDDSFDPLGLFNPALQEQLDRSTAGVQGGPIADLRSETIIDSSDSFPIHEEIDSFYKEFFADETKTHEGSPDRDLALGSTEVNARTETESSADLGEIDPGVEDLEDNDLANYGDLGSDLGDLGSDLGDFDDIGDIGGLDLLGEDLEGEGLSPEASATDSFAETNEEIDLETNPETENLLEVFEAVLFGKNGEPLGKLPQETESPDYSIPVSSPFIAATEHQPFNDSSEVDEVLAEISFPVDSLTDPIVSDGLLSRSVSAGELATEEELLQPFDLFSEESVFLDPFVEATPDRSPENIALLSEVDESLRGLLDAGVNLPEPGNSEFDNRPDYPETILPPASKTITALTDLLEETGVGTALGSETQFNTSWPVTPSLPLESVNLEAANLEAAAALKEDYPLASPDETLLAPDESETTLEPQLELEPDMLQQLNEDLFSLEENPDDLRWSIEEPQASAFNDSPPETLRERSQWSAADPEPFSSGDAALTEPDLGELNFDDPGMILDHRALEEDTDPEFIWEEEEILVTPASPARATPAVNDSPLERLRQRSEDLLETELDDPFENLPSRFNYRGSPTGLQSSALPPTATQPNNLDAFLEDLPESIPGVGEETAEGLGRWFEEDRATPQPNLEEDPEIAALFPDFQEEDAQEDLFVKKKPLL